MSFFLTKEQSFISYVLGAEEGFAIPGTLTHVSETLGSLTWLCSYQLYTFTQDFILFPHLYLSS